MASLEDQNKGVFRRFVDEFWNARDLDVASELFAADAILTGAPDLPTGPAGVTVNAQAMFSAFSEFRTEITNLVASGDKVAARLLREGTHQGEFAGVPATGKRATWTEIGILQIKDGKIVKSWFQPDMLTLMQQLGAVPEAG